MVQENKSGITVLMSIYQKENPVYFKEAMESILAQTRPADEILLMVDGPLTEELEEMIAYFKKKCDILRTYRFPQNVKLGAALRKGVEIASHEWIARMDTDDIACVNRLELQEAFLQQHPEVAVLGGGIQEFCDKPEYRLLAIKRIPGGEALKRYQKYRCPVNHMTVLMRRSAIIDAGNYEHFPGLEDYHLWSRVIAKGYRLDNVPEVLVHARTNENFYGRRGGKEYGKRYMQLRKMQRSLGLLTGMEYIWAKICTMVMVFSPNKVRKILYKFLRES